MKILMIVPFLPNIQTSGGQTRWYNIIKYLSKDHDITLFSLIKDDSERKYIPELETYCRKVRVFKRPKKPWTFRNIFLSIFSPFPLLLIRNFSFQERIAVKKELKDEKYDVIHAEAFYVMPHIPKTPVPSIQVEQTIWHEVYEHHVKTKIPIVVRPFFMLDVYKLKYWEIYFWKKATKLFTVSSDDKLIMEKLIPGENVDVIPNGVDAKYFSQKKVAKKFPKRVFYGVTNFEWLQNREAVDILLKEVWPKIKIDYKDTKLWIVGRKIPDELVRLSQSDNDFEITESIVDSRDAYGGASVMVTPIHGAGGTRLKILEAMAAGLPVVSTTVGVAGLGLTHGKNAFISDNMDTLAQYTIQLLKDDQLSRTIGERGRNYIKKNYDWQAIVKLHDAIYKDVTQERKKRYE